MTRSLASALASALLGLAACGDSSGPTACDVGEEILEQNLTALFASEPACSSDSDCIVVNTDVDCDGFSAGTCGSIVHRASASKWSADKVCQQIDHASVPSKYSCGSEPSCASVHPACVNQACTAVDD